MEQMFRRFLTRRSAGEAVAKQETAVPQSQSFEGIERVANEAMHYLDKTVEEASAQENPYRSRALMGPDPLYESDAWRKFMTAMDGIDGVLRAVDPGVVQQHPLMSLRKRVVGVYERFSQASGAFVDQISAIDKRIRSARIMTERGVEDPYTTAVQFIRMNHASVEQPPEAWDTETVSKMELPEFTRHINENGSGRFFLHGFPQISLEQGHIANGVGGDSLLGGFEVSRDKNIAINFTAEGPDRAIQQFYLVLGRGIGGGVLYPAEAILQNYAYINLPYTKDLETSGEWRTYGPPENKMSPLHIIPLKMGVCFFSTEDEPLVNELLAKLPEDIRPNKVIFHSDTPAAALREYLKELKQPEGLPRISRSVDVIGEVSGIPVFGTSRAKDLWSSEQKNDDIEHAPLV